MFFLRLLCVTNVINIYVNLLFVMEEFGRWFFKIVNEDEFALIIIICKKKWNV